MSFGAGTIAVVIKAKPLCPGVLEGYRIGTAYRKPDPHSRCIAAFAQELR